MARSLTHSLTYLLPFLLTHSLTHSLTHAVMGDHNLPRILQLLERAREKAKSGEFHEAIKEYEAGIRVLSKITTAPDMVRLSGKTEELR